MAKIQGLATTGPLHIISDGSAGAVIASTSADGLVIESDSSTGLSILTPANTVGIIAFGSPTSNTRGQIAYNHNLDILQLFSASAETMRLDGNQNLLLAITTAAATAQGNLHIGIDTSPTAVLVGGVVIGAKDSSVGSTDATLELWLETAPIAVGTFTPSHKFPIWINGTEYHIQLDAV